ncbi:MAG: thiamine phosphate synthase [Thermoplasmatales archaeon]
MKSLPSGIYGITTSKQGLDHLSSAEILLESGITIIQYREKNVSTREMISQARRLREICNSYNAIFIVNDRVDVAYASDADGIHVGQDDFPPELVKDILGDVIIGVSASSITEGIEGEMHGASYIGAGSVFKSNTKPEERVIGIDGFAGIVKAVHIPVYAIGGIKLEHIALIKKLGARGAAVISGIFDSSDPLSSARAFVNKWRTTDHA